MPEPPYASLRLHGIACYPPHLSPKSCPKDRQHFIWQQSAATAKLLGAQIMDLPRPRVRDLWEYILIGLCKEMHGIYRLFLGAWGSCRQ